MSTQPGKLVELSEEDETRIAELLVGRRIVSAETGTFALADHWNDASGRLTLDDGRQVYVVPNQGGCACSAGDYELTHLAAVDNIITSVRLAETLEADQWGEGPKRYEIFVVADATEINLLSIDGDDGNGYYGTGYRLFVTEASAVQS